MKKSKGYGKVNSNVFEYYLTNSSFVFNAGYWEIGTALDTPSALPYHSTQLEAYMDYLSPIVGTVTGIEIAQWKAILVFGLKVTLFSVPFVVIGLLVEKDVIRVPVVNRIVKSLVILIFTLPVFFFGILNYIAPGLSDAFWERYPALEGFWIMEGGLAPAILSGMAMLYLVLYVLETARGDLSN